MANASAWLLALGQMTFLVLLGPLVTGVIQKLKARLQSRRGAGVLQPYRDLAKLLRKGTVQADTTGSFFRAVPALVLAATCSAAALVPVLVAPPSAGAAAPLPLGDAILLLGWLALARFLAAVGALDAGGAFGGMGASREMTVATLVEPVAMLVVFSVTVAAGTTDLGALAAHSTGGRGPLGAPDVLALFAMLLLLLAETGRIPVDNPDTHLELTMLHEGMLLEHSGPGLFCLHLAHHTKQIVVIALVQALFLPWMASSPAPVALALALGAFTARTLVLSVFLALVESSYAKLRLFRLPQFLGLGFLCAFLAVALRVL
jgi:formate hydrogenlyase subunit 4